MRSELNNYEKSFNFETEFIQKPESFAESAAIHLIASEVDAPLIGFDPESSQREFFKLRYRNRNGSFNMHKPEYTISRSYRFSFNKAYKAG